MSAIYHAGHRRLQDRFDTRDARDPLLAPCPGAQLVVRVREVFPNCARYIHTLQRVEASAFVPRPGCATPVPEWTKSDWARDVLPSGDPARDA
jgi:hypothetical protein